MNIVIDTNTSHLKKITNGEWTRDRGRIHFLRVCVPSRHAWRKRELFLMRYSQRQLSPLIFGLNFTDFWFWGLIFWLFYWNRNLLSLSLSALFGQRCVCFSISNFIFVFSRVNSRSSFFHLFLIWSCFLRFDSISETVIFLNI